MHSIETMVRRIQRAYPQVWFACHVVHRKRGPAAELTDREAGVLAHIADAPGSRASDLARHLGLRPSTLSAQLKRLARLGLVAVGTGRNRREKAIRLTAAGEAAVSALSPLATERVAALLEELEPSAQRAAVSGLELLADAARRRAAGREG